MASKKPVSQAIESAYLSDATNFIETWLNHYFPQLNQPSLSLAIAHNGKVIYQKAWGYANIEKQEAATPQHIYRVASHSKSFTAFLVAMLVDEGKLNLDEPILTYLPWLRSNPTFAAFTLRQILSHSTGMERDSDETPYWNLHGPFPASARLKSYFAKAKPALEPNTQFKYSNYGYGLVGMVIEAATQESYTALITRKILKPLQLKQTGVDNPPPDAKVSFGYTSPLNSTRVALNPFISADALVPATGFHSTPSDLTRFFHTLVLGNGMISRAMQKELLHSVWGTVFNKPEEQFYALGLIKVLHKGKVCYGHTGGYPGHSSRTIVIPHLNITIGICMNSLNADHRALFLGLWDILEFFHTERGTNNPLTRYETPYFYLAGMNYILAGANKLHIASLGSSNPLADATQLIPHTADTFQISTPDSYSTIGQPASFTFKNGKPALYRQGGITFTTSLNEHLKHLKSLAAK